MSIRLIQSGLLSAMAALFFDTPGHTMAVTPSRPVYLGVGFKCHKKRREKKSKKSTTKISKCNNTINNIYRTT